MKITVHTVDNVGAVLQNNITYILKHVLPRIRPPLAERRMSGIGVGIRISRSGSELLIRVIERRAVFVRTGVAVAEEDDVLLIHAEHCERVYRLFQALLRGDAVVPVRDVDDIYLTAVADIFLYHAPGEIDLIVLMWHDEHHLFPGIQRLLAVIGLAVFRQVRRDCRYDRERRQRRGRQRPYACAYPADSPHRAPRRDQRGDQTCEEHPFQHLPRHAELRKSAHDHCQQANSCRREQRL